MEAGIIISAGTVISIWTNIGGISEKCAMMLDSAGERIIPPLDISPTAAAA